MAKELKHHGAHKYSIFLDEATGKLFAYVEIENEETWNKMASTDVCQKWWAYMKPLMETNKGSSLVSVQLKEIFYLA